MKFKSSIVSLVMAIGLAGCGVSDDALVGTFASFSFSSSGDAYLEFEGKNATYAESNALGGFHGKREFKVKYQGDTISLTDKDANYVLQYREEGEHTLLDCVNCEEMEDDFHDEWIRVGEGMLNDALDEESRKEFERSKMEAKIAKEVSGRLSLLAEYDGTWIPKLEDDEGYLIVMSISHKRADIPVKMLIIDSKTGSELDYMPFSFSIEGERLILEPAMATEPDFETFVLDKRSFQLKCVSCSDRSSDLYLDYYKMTDINNIRRLAGLSAI